MGKIKKVAKWAVPISADLNRQVNQALKRKDIRKEYLKSEHSESFVSGLRYAIEQENIRNKRLRGTATILDSANKALVPVDAGVDAATIAFGIGLGAKAILTLGKLPFYIAYNLYYAGKTHDIAGVFGNIGYEAASWATPGSLPHLINKYTRQADRYAVRKGSENYLYKLEKSGLEEKTADIINISSRKRKRKKEDLEKLAEAA